MWRSRRLLPCRNSWDTWPPWQLKKRLDFFRYISGIIWIYIFVYIYICVCVYKYNMCIHTLVFQFPKYLEPGVYLPDKNIHVYINIYIYTWNLFVPCFWASTLQKKALSNQNKVHLGSWYEQYIYVIKYALYKYTTPIGWLWDLQLQLWMPCHVDLPNVGLGLSSNSTVFTCGVGSHMWL